jgi:hypothetical protein
MNQTGYLGYDEDSHQYNFGEGNGTALKLGKGLMDKSMRSNGYIAGAKKGPNLTEEIAQYTQL